ncbi:prepilin peptidase [Xanthobacter sediminis]
MAATSDPNSNPPQDGTGGSGLEPQQAGAPSDVPSGPCRPCVPGLAARPLATVALVALTLAGMGASLALDGGLAANLPGPLGVLPLSALAAAAFVPVVVAIAVIDGRHFIIPDTLNGAGLVLGLVHAAGGAAGGVPQALVRGAVLALAFLALRVGYRALRGREGLGLGDVKLAGVAGVWLDEAAILVAVEVAAVSALVAIGARQLVDGRRARRDARLPFGLFLAPAIWIAWALERMLWGGI